MKVIEKKTQNWYKIDRVEYPQENDTGKFFTSHTLLYLISQNLDPLSESSSLAHGEQSGCT
jgi:hypothetical protein